MLDTIPPSNWREYFTGAMYFFNTLPSTQQFVTSHPPLLAPIFCQTRTQTAGVGQRGKPWQQTGEALLFSCAITLPGELALQQGLTQALALALVSALDPDNQFLKLKWPNDIYHQQRKLAGILLEGSPHPLDRMHSQMIIGIGINIANEASKTDDQQQDMAFWQEIYPQQHTEEILNKIMPALIACIDNWAERPYLPIDHQWREYDLYDGQQVRLENHSPLMQVLGIDQKGRLLCRADDNTLHYLTNTRILRS